MSQSQGSHITAQNYASVSLEQYQSRIIETWPELMSRPALYTWLRVVKHATAACEGVRKSAWNEALEEIGTLVVWWLAFIAKLNALATSSSADNDIVFAIPFSASDIVWGKYPGVCPVEFGLAVRDSIPRWDKRYGPLCMCLAQKRAVDERPPEQKEFAKQQLRLFAARNHQHRPRSMADFEKALRKVFSGPVYSLTIDEIALHLMEEIGEVSQALAEATTSHAARAKEVDLQEFEEERNRRAQSIAEELADVFSWAVTFVDKVRLQYTSFAHYFAAGVPVTQHAQVLRQIQDLVEHTPEEINLADIIWKKYGANYGEFRCAVCGEPTCRCEEENQRLLHGEILKSYAPNIRTAILNLASDTALPRGGEPQGPS